MVVALRFESHTFPLPTLDSHRRIQMPLKTLFDTKFGDRSSQRKTSRIHGISRQENKTKLLSEFCEIRFHYDNLNMGYPPTQPRTFVFGLVLNRLSTERFRTDQIVILVACWF